MEMHAFQPWASQPVTGREVLPSVHYSLGLRNVFFSPSKGPWKYKASKKSGSPEV